MLKSRAAVVAALTLLLSGCTAAVAQQAQPALTAPALVNPQDAAAKAWGLSQSDIPLDPAVRLGVLSNGMKYALMANATPKDSVLIRFHFDVGSLAEAEDQRGLAHFLEHMAFNGSTNVPEGEMVKLLERKGLAFGADTNASTGFDTTTYLLDLPNASDDLVDTGLMLMRETASELTINPAAVDRERGVILSERRVRDTFQLRNAIASLGFYFPNMTLKDRLPVGTEEVLRGAPAQRLRDFYDAYYRPERASLVIVGDFDVAAMEAKIKARFADWQGRGVNGPDPDIGKPDAKRRAAADIYVDPAIADTVSLTATRPWAFEADTRARRTQSIAETLGAAILNRRFEKLALAEDSPIQGASFNTTRAWDTVDQASVAAAAKQGEWRAALALVDAEWRRALQHGFTDAELAEVIANRRTALENAVTGVSTRRRGGLAGGLLAMVDGDGRAVFSRPEVARDLFAEVAPTLTAASVSAAFRERHAGYGEPLVRVTAKAPVDGGADAVLAAWRQATAVAVAPPASQASATFAYTDFGAPGRVVADERVADLDIRRVRFANNVMLNIKRTDFQADRVAITVRVDGGNALATREDPTRVALGAALVVGGLGAHSFSDLQSILAGRSVSAAWGSTDFGFGGSATTTPKDLPLQAQLFAAFLTQPGWRADGLALVRRVLPQQYAANDATPSAVLARDVPGILANDDPRVATPPLEKLLTLDWDGVRTASADMLARGAIEIGIVGDIQEDAAIAAIASTFGALPERNASFAAWADARQRAFASNRAPRTLIHKGPADQAEVRLYWDARDDSDLTEALHIDLLARVLQIALTDELRERLGKTYGADVRTDLSTLYPGFGHIFAGANVDIADVAATEAAIRKVAADLAAAPPSADLIDRARKPLLENMIKARRENSYWLNSVGFAASRPERLDRDRQGIPMVEKIRAADLQAAARKYLTDERLLIVRAVSDKAPK
ncbi:MAG: insulinase family protein [Sphingopyxis sp.]|nr:insulinase family protein [Sphingopyxis sp.]